MGIHRISVKRSSRWVVDLEDPEVLVVGTEDPEEDLEEVEVARRQPEWDDLRFAAEAETPLEAVLETMRHTKPEPVERVAGTMEGRVECAGGTEGPMARESVVKGAAVERKRRRDNTSRAWRPGTGSLRW